MEDPLAEPMRIMRTALERQDRLVRARLADVFLRTTFGGNVNAPERARIVSESCFTMSEDAVRAYDSRRRRAQKRSRRRG